MAEQERQTNTTSRAQILDADYIPRDQAPNTPGGAPAARRDKKSGGSVVPAVLVLAAVMAIAAAVSRGDRSDAPAGTAAEAPPAAFRDDGTAPPRSVLAFPDGDSPRLGVVVQKVTAVTAEYYNRRQENAMVPGVQVYALDSDGAGAAAGLREGDIITALDGRSILSPEELAQAELDCRAGDAVTLTVFRNGEYVDVAAVLGEKTAREDESFPAADPGEG